MSKTVLGLILLGGLNWGLIGAFNFDLVAFLFGPMSGISRTLYILIGLAALWVFFSSFYPSIEAPK